MKKSTKKPEIRLIKVEHGCTQYQKLLRTLAVLSATVKSLSNSMCHLSSDLSAMKKRVHKLEQKGQE